MKKSILKGLLVISFLNDYALAAENEKSIQFFCGSDQEPVYEFLVDSSGAVEEITDGHFSKGLSVNETVVKNGEVRVTLSPFHAYCFIGIEYTNYTNHFLRADGTLQFSETAEMSRTCEGGPLETLTCTVKVK